MPAGTVGTCYLCGLEGTVIIVERPSDEQQFPLCGRCALVEERRRRHGGSTLLVAQNAMPEGS